MYYSSPVALMLVSITPSGFREDGSLSPQNQVLAMALGKLIRGFADSVTGSLAVVAKTTTNLSNSNEGLKLRLLPALRSVVLELRKFKTDLLDEICRGRAEDRALIQEAVDISSENRQELQNLRALIICAFDQDHEGQN